MAPIASERTYVSSASYGAYVCMGGEERALKGRGHE
jgi:hypothetical protein